MRRYLFFFLMLLVLAAVPAAASTHDSGFSVGIELPLMFLIGGLVINADSLTALYRNFLTIFNQAVTAYQPQWSKVAMKVPSSTSENVYAWLGAFPKMREWLGERQYKNLTASDWTIKNKEWESTVAVRRTTIEDDQYGVFTPVIAAMGASAVSQPDDLVFDLLNNGFTNKGYDGKTFFATNHDSGSNKDSGGGSVLSTTSFGSAIAKIKRVKDSSGKYLFNGMEKLTLVVPPELEETAKKLLNSDFISVASGSTQNNIWKNAADLLISPKLTSATAWFLLVEFNGLKALILQERQAPEFESKVDPTTSDHVFKNNEYLYGAYARNNAGYGLHQLAFGSVGA